jgi:2,4-dienoyl-CoA reductase-like NADH-dependent reductase (Old Yellow Enzyme family)
MLDNKGLYDSVQLGALTLSNRVFMALLTRNRADANDVSGPMAKTYSSTSFSTIRSAR